MAALASFYALHGVHHGDRDEAAGGRRDRSASHRCRRAIVPLRLDASLRRTQSRFPLLQHYKL